MAKRNCKECAKHREVKLKKLAKKLKKVLSHVSTYHGEELNIAEVQVIDGCIIVHTGDYL